jgi:hypothetical protein
VNNRLLCICPSRGRPDRIKTMLDSYISTKSDFTDMYIYLDNDDPELSKYDFKEYDVKVEIGERQHLVPIYNHAWKVNNDYSYYFVANDDLVFRTKNWDKMLIDTIIEKGNGWGIAYGDDLHGNVEAGLPDFSVMSANIVNTMGCIYPDRFLRLWCDFYYRDLGNSVGKLFCNKDVIIEHIRVHNPDEDLDEYKSTVTTDRNNYIGYVQENQQADAEKLLNAIIAEQLK